MQKPWLGLQPSVEAQSNKNVALPKVDTEFYRMLSSTLHTIAGAPKRTDTGYESQWLKKIAWEHEKQQLFLQQGKQCKALMHILAKPAQEILRFLCQMYS